ncbi:DUF736 domain-containing protein [Methylobacterium platani]|uniref:DUF736 domain-containing protein n=2 Tax=Methylobacterium platani TaxID=427683 RepID=A0A179S0T0_9HYPH|nr:DUF736 domain-containing protein [Methylobacterium platani]KMO14842.1 hypothetical protein SQ03_18265 [Methylobacterium platani JCM 14648]OAS16163.1 hypothetical protein A5481_28425 [Methylobacterium platani]
MATIGTFTQTQNGFSGEITTLTIQAKKVSIQAETERMAEKGPTHRIYLGKAEIGAGWAKRSNEGRDYISIKIDDPSLTGPLYARLFAEEDGRTHSLVWTRSNGPNGRRQD